MGTDTRQAFYWTTIPKNRPSYHPSRGVTEEETTRIIQDHLVVKPDLDTAETRMLAVGGLARFHAGLKTAREKEDFRRHLRRYMSIYLPDCPFEVSSTNRYTVVTHEACITARRYIRKNETIRYLCGIQVAITAKEEEEISKRKKDFSIVVSSRSKSTSLFMGPARFANHDCDANAKLMTTGQGGMEVVATKDIDVGDEITVTYGESYFGEDNCECLCQTCEDNLVNGWASKDGRVRVKPSIEQDSLQGYSLRRRRRDGSTRESSRTPSVTPDIRPRVWKTRSRSQRLGEKLHATTLSPSTEPSSLKRPFSAVATPPFTPSKKQKVLELDGTDPIPLSLTGPPSETASEHSSRSGSSNDVGALTDATSVDKESPQLSASDAEVVLTVEEVEAAAAMYPSPSSSPSSTVRQAALAEKMEELPCAIALSVELAATEPEPAKSGKGVRKRDGQGTPPAKTRTPGDYTLTPLLLSEPEMAWVTCTNCSGAFVQQNAYYTRSSCPRCERHSKLYGYVWPKTEKAGSRDTEERVLDHRTVHRFLDADGEAKARGRKRPAWMTNRKYEDEGGDSEQESDGRRRSGRARRASIRVAV
jgi:[histone H4]-N-methyl-L-lysine20 N-methyltransferase